MEGDLMNTELCFPKRIIIVALCLLINTGYVLAGLEVSGIFQAEIVSDPLNFNPSVPTTDPWQNQSGSISSSFFNVDFTKIGLELKLEDNGVDVYWPLTLAVRAQSTATTPSFQAYVLADDYLNIPYHAIVNTDYFNFSLSNKPVGTKLGFIDTGDLLGIAKSLNSPQPLLSFKITGNNLPGNWGMQAYILFDQKVNALPSWERLPSGAAEVGSEILAGKAVAQYGFTDERAGYNILRLDKAFGNQSHLGITYAQKNVSNPAFRENNNPKSDAHSLLYWGYLKENLGVDYEKTGQNSRWQAAFVGSSAQWRKYQTTAQRIEKAAYVLQYFPFDVKGELTGNAGALKGEFTIGKRTYKFDALAVEPYFQAVAASCGQFPTVNLLESRSSADGALKRSVYAVFDPLGELTDTSSKSSPVFDYLGKRFLRLSVEEKGYVGPLPVLFNLQGTKVSPIDKLEDAYTHRLTGAKIIKDYQEVRTQLLHRGVHNEYSLLVLDREYLADADYLKQAKGSYQYEKNNFKFTANLDQTWRLRADDLLGEGSSIRGYLAFGLKLSQKSSISLGLDHRVGTYDYDLINSWDDQVVDNYTYRGLNLYLQREQEFAFGGNSGSALLAAELLRRNTDLREELNGTSTIGYFNLDLPWNQKIKSTHIFIGVGGPQQSSFPSNYLNSTFHQEISYEPLVDTKFRVAYTNWPGLGDGNLFAELVVKQGAGTFSLGYGKATIPSLALFHNTLAGSLSFDGVGYPPAKSLRGRPWEMWDSASLYGMRDQKLHPTDQTWHNYLTLRYWYSF